MNVTEEIEKLQAGQKEINTKLNRDFDALKTTKTKLSERDKIEESYILGRKITGTTHASAGTETTHPHYLGRIPSYIFITPTSDGIIYKSKSPDKTNIYVKGSAISLTFDAYVLL